MSQNISKRKMEETMSQQNCIYSSCVRGCLWSWRFNYGLGPPICNRGPKDALSHAMREKPFGGSQWVCTLERVCMNRVHGRACVCTTDCLPLDPGRLLPAHDASRFIYKPWKSGIWRGPLMYPWALRTQTESLRRPHMDNRAALPGFWKVTLRIAFNT